MNGENNFSSTARTQKLRTSERESYDLCECPVLNLKSNMTAIWDTGLHSLMEVDRRFRGVYYRHLMALMMEAVSTSETPVYFHETTR
jgi:hypothetical protein